MTFRASKRVAQEIWKKEVEKKEESEVSSVLNPCEFEEELDRMKIFSDTDEDRNPIQKFMSVSTKHVDKTRALLKNACQLLPL